MDKKRVDTLREASGRVVYKDPLTSFFYQLIRDELPAGKVEKIIQDIIDEEEKEIIFTNGWLAQYANNLAETLKNAHTEKLKESLEKAFDEEEKEREAAAAAKKAMEKLRNSGTLEDFTNDELAELESKVVTACQKVEEADTEKTEPVVAWTSLEEAAEMIEHLRAEGQISKEDAERLNNEIKEVEAEITTEKEQEAPADAIAEVKPVCCGRCKHNDNNTISGTCATLEDTEKCQSTQKSLTEMDKEPETPQASAKETKIVYIAEPTAIGKEEAKEINDMLNGMENILNVEQKKEE